MKLFLDTNVILDIALDRKPFVDHAILLWRLAEQKKIMDEDGFREALNSDMADFEDAVQYVIALRNNCDALITRNKTDFGNRANIFGPEEMLQQIAHRRT